MLSAALLLYASFKSDLYHDSPEDLKSHIQSHRARLCKRPSKSNVSARVQNILTRGTYKSLLSGGPHDRKSVLLGCFWRKISTRRCLSLFENRGTKLRDGAKFSCDSISRSRRWIPRIHVSRGRFIPTRILNGNRCFAVLIGRNLGNGCRGTVRAERRHSRWLLSLLPLFDATMT